MPPKVDERHPCVTDDESVRRVSGIYIYICEVRFMSDFVHFNGKLHAVLNRAIIWGSTDRHSALLYQNRMAHFVVYHKI